MSKLIMTILFFLWVLSIKTHEGTNQTVRITVANLCDYFIEKFEQENKYKRKQLEDNKLLDKIDEINI